MVMVDIFSGFEVTPLWHQQGSAEVVQQAFNGAGPLLELRPHFHQFAGKGKVRLGNARLLRDEGPNSNQWLRNEDLVVANALGLSDDGLPVLFGPAFGNPVFQLLLLLSLQIAFERPAIRQQLPAHGFKQVFGLQRCRVLQNAQLALDALHDTHLDVPLPRCLPHVTLNIFEPTAGLVVIYGTRDGFLLGLVRSLFGC